MMAHAYLAIDLGAESGRAIVGVLDKDDRLTLHEMHRFEHEPMQLPTGLHWDTEAMWSHIVEGMRAAGAWCRTHDVKLHAIGVDSWGVDFALLDSSGQVLRMPHAYRDPRNGDGSDHARERVPDEELYAVTGIQRMPINTLFQLCAYRLHDSSLLDAADRLLFTPDLFHYFLSGRMINERTIASTSQMLDARTGRWSRDLLERLDLPAPILHEIVEPGTVIAPILPTIAGETTLDEDTLIIAPASHDTASAVAAIPALEGASSCYLSSGTWSLLGAELEAPCISEAARTAPFTNETGLEGTVRFLKNITGLWLVQECRREFASRGETYDYRELTALAREAQPFRTLIDPAHHSFTAPGGMVDKIKAFAYETGQPTPGTPGEYIRCCLESLALTYRDTLRQMESILEMHFEVLHIVGGGIENELLNQMTANATGLPVIAGPREAAAAGNILVQAIANGRVREVSHARGIVRDSFTLQTYEPRDTGAWIGRDLSSL